MSINRFSVTTTIFLLLSVATTTTFCHREETREKTQTQTQIDPAGENLSLDAKASYTTNKGKPDGGLLTSWNPSTSKADFTVAKGGSGTHKTINDALTALGKMGSRRNQRVTIYVKEGVYNEKVKIGKNMENVTFVGDGMDRTIVTGRFNTYRTSTFVVSADGFWARDMTFENTAGPEKQQAVALRVNSDQSIFYRCSFKGYQNTLLVEAKRQFYRDCHIYGTVDIISGYAAAMFQNCDIFVRRPIKNQDNTITAQARLSHRQHSGISIQGSRVRPAPDFVAVKSLSRTFLGRAAKNYSRTVIFETDLDDLIDPRGWSTESKDNASLSTLFFAEYKNTGAGASTNKRVKWPGFHVLKTPKEARPFTVNHFIHGEKWIPATGVPCELGV